MSKTKFSKYSIAASLLLFLCATLSSLAQNTATLSISGEVKTPLELKLTDLASFKQVSHKVKDRDGREHVFAGVALIELLEKAGVTTGAKLRVSSHLALNFSIILPARESIKKDKA